MLTAVPRNWFSWDFTLRDAGEHLAEIDISWWREKGVLTVANKPYRVYREGLFTGAFLLESDGATLSRAEKPSAFSRRIIVEYAGVRYELKPRNIFSRGFQLRVATTVIGTLAPYAFWSRRVNVDLPDALPLPVKVFVVWLTIILWKRDADAAEKR